MTLATSVDVDQVQDLIERSLSASDPRGRVYVGTGFRGLINLAIVSRIFDGRPPDEREQQARKVIKGLPREVKGRLRFSLLVTPEEARDYIPTSSLNSPQVVRIGRKNYRIAPMGRVVLEGHTTSFTYEYMVEGMRERPQALYVSFPIVELLSHGISPSTPYPEGRLLGFAMTKVEGFFRGSTERWEKHDWGNVYRFDSSTGDEL